MTLWQLIGLLIAGCGFGLALGLCIYANELRKRPRPSLPSDDVFGDVPNLSSFNHDEGFRP